MLDPTDVSGAVLPKEPSLCNVIELKRWLECHGQKKGGKKQELFDRVKDCLSLKINIDPKVDGGKWYEMKVSQQQQQHKKPESNIFPKTGWKSFPSVDIPTVFNYGRTCVPLPCGIHYKCGRL